MSDQIPEEVAALPQEQPPVESATTQEEPVEATGETKESKAEKPEETEGVQKRMGELRKQAGVAERQAREAQKLNERLVSLLEQTTSNGGKLPSVENAPSGPPRRGDFEGDDEAYWDARARYQASQVIKEVETRQERSRAEQSVAQREAEWSRRQEVAATKYDDYEEVVSAPDLRISPVMAEAIKDSDVGHELAYHLGKNPSEAARIAQLSPVSQVRELGKIEARLTTVTSKPVSKASTPIDPITGGKGGSGNPATMSMDDYAAWREKRGK